MTEQHEWTYEYDNWGNGGFSQWWALLRNGEHMGKGISTSEDDAKMVVSMLNEYETLKALSEDYLELIMAVSDKHEGETRHETALRYIQEVERGSDTACANTLEDKP